MEEPYVRRVGRIESVVGFQVHKEPLPFLAEASGNVVPKTFDTGIMDGSTPWTSANRPWEKMGTDLPHMKDPRFCPRTSSMKRATSTFSTP